MTKTYGTHIHDMLQPFLGAPAWAVELGLMMALIIEEGKAYMAELDDKLAAIQAAQADEKAKLDKFIADVTAKLASFPDPGTLSTAQQAALADILSHVTANATSLDTADASVSVPPAAAPAAAAPVASS